MSDFSRDSLRATQNVLNDLRGVTTAQPNPKHYVSIRLQQAVPLLDADWNEQEDLRRIEVELVLASLIGNGAPLGSDGFRIHASVDARRNLAIAQGLLLIDGWLVYNPAPTDYREQPHRTTPGVAPALPPLLPASPTARRELVYLDAWERLVNSQEDENLVDQRIGIETALRVERAWVVRMAPLTSSADPLNPQSIPNRQTGHRYYPLALINRPAGDQISDGMITDLRRTHLNLAALTHAPLSLMDPVRDHKLDADRLADAFAANLAALDDVFRFSPNAFVFAGQEIATWQWMTLYQDLRALAVTYREQARRDTFDQTAALDVMTRFFAMQRTVSQRLEQLVQPPPTGVGAGPATQAFLANYNAFLMGGPLSLETAINEGDLLGSVLAQERINHEVSRPGGSRLDGTLSVSLTNVTPNDRVVPNVTHQLTLRINSQLISAAGQEAIRLAAGAGPGWTLVFANSSEVDRRELVTVVPNQTTQEVVLNLTAAAGATPTELAIKALPERRKLLVFRNEAIPLALGSEILAEAEIIAALGYQGPVLQPGNIAAAPRSLFFNPGVELPFRIQNLSSAQQTFELTITPTGAATGWDATPRTLAIAPLAAGQNRNVPIRFRTSNQAGAQSPQTFTVGLSQVVGTARNPLTYTAFSITFQLT